MLKKNVGIAKISTCKRNLNTIHKNEHSQKFRAKRCISTLEWYYKFSSLKISQQVLQITHYHQHSVNDL